MPDISTDVHVQVKQQDVHHNMPAGAQVRQAIYASACWQQCVWLAECGVRPCLLTEAPVLGSDGGDVRLDMQALLDLITALTHLNKQRSPNCSHADILLPMLIYKFASVYQAV